VIKFGHKYNADNQASNYLLNFLSLGCPEAQPKGLIFPLRSTYIARLTRRSAFFQKIPQFPGRSFEAKLRVCRVHKFLPQ